MRARFVGTGAAAVAAVLYVLIGVGVLDIGGRADGGTEGLTAFGLAAGASFTVVALVVLLGRRRAVLVPALVFTLGVIVFYFVVADVREPAVEVWGLTVKAVQVVLLGALLVLVARPRRAGASVGHGRSTVTDPASV